MHLALAGSSTTSTHAVAQAKAAPRAVGIAFRDGGARPEMIVLSTGNFTMGSSAEENPGPRVTVTVCMRLLMKLRKMLGWCGLVDA